MGKLEIKGRETESGPETEPAVDTPAVERGDARPPRKRKGEVQSAPHGKPEGGGTAYPSWAFRLDASRFSSPAVAASLERPVMHERPYLVARAGWTAQGKAVSTTDQTYFDGLGRLREAVSKIPTDTSGGEADWDGFYRGSFNFDGFARLGSLMGVPGRPVPQPPNDSRVFRKDKGLRPMSADEKSIAKCVAEIVLPYEVRAESIYVDKVSSAGAPSRLKGIERLIAAQAPFAEAETAVPMLLNGDLEGYYSKYNLVHVSSPVYRDQTEKRGKVRVAQTFSGKSVEVAPDLPAHLLETAPEWAYACRRRLANSVPDCCIDEALLADAWKSSVDDNIAYTAVNRTPEQIMVKAVAATGAGRDEGSSLSFAAFDIDNCDQTIEPDLIKIWVEILSARVGPVWAARMLMSIRTPALYRQTEPGLKGYYLSGNPFEMSGFKTWYSNPSGHRATTQVAQLAGITYAVIAAIRAGWFSFSVSNVRAFLQGTLSGMCVFNAGDNILFACNDRKRRAAIVEVMADLGFVAASTTETFLGQTPAVVGGTKRFVASLATSVYNLVSPARSVHDEREGDVLAGAGPRDVHYSTNPTYVKSVRPAIADFMADIGVVTYRAAMEKRTPALQAVDGEVYDVATLLATNFDAIYYKIARKDIPEKWLKEHFLRILETDAAKWVVAANKFPRNQATDLVSKLLAA